MSRQQIVMVGAGSVVFARTLMTDILSLPALSNARIALHDSDGRRLETAEMMVRRVADAVGAHPIISATLDRRTALRDADYVINSIQVGGHDATLADFEIPKTYGLKQTIADTLGIGGIFRALRTMPIMLDMCSDMRAVCPNALLLNYTNPMAMLCLAVERAGGVRVVGLCHSVQHTADRLADYIGVPRDDIWFRVAGINHMAWFLDLRRRGIGTPEEDLYPALFRAMNTPETFGRDKVRFEMMRRTGYFVTESSEHMSEYLPYFIKRDSLIEQFDIPIDEYVRRSERNLGRFEETRKVLSSNDPLELKPSHEFAAYIIQAIETNRDWSFHGNVLNRGLIDNLPSDSCVEVPTLVNAAGLQPSHVGALPNHLAGLNRTNINVQQLVVDAVLNADRDAVYHAAMLDPHTAATLSLDEIWAMTDELIDAHGDLLPPLRSRRLHALGHA